MDFVSAIIPLENLSVIPNHRHDTYCLIARKDLAARIHGRDLTPFECERMQRLRLKTARDRFLLAHTLKRRFLACLLECAPADIVVTFGKQGKPLLEGRDLQFSISYAEDWIAVIFTSCGTVGIDLEYPTCSLRGACNSLDISGSRDLPVDMVMNPADRFQPSPDDPTQRFYTCWTLKEAISKADGRGLNIAFDRIRLTPQASGVYCGYVDKDIWQARHLKLADGTHLAHACKTLLEPYYVLIG